MRCASPTTSPPTTPADQLSSELSAFTGRPRRHTRALAVRGSDRWSPGRCHAAHHCLDRQRSDGSRCARAGRTVQRRDARRRGSTFGDAAGSRFTGDDVLVLRAGQPHRRWPGVDRGHPLDSRLRPSSRPGPTAKCVESTITTADSEGALILLAALQSWASLAPAESTHDRCAGRHQQDHGQGVRPRRSSDGFGSGEGADGVRWCRRRAGTGPGRGRGGQRHTRRRDMPRDGGPKPGRRSQHAGGRTARCRSGLAAAVRRRPTSTSPAGVCNQAG